MEASSFKEQPTTLDRRTLKVKHLGSAHRCNKHDYRRHFSKRLDSPLLEPVDLQLYVLLLNLLHHTPAEGTRHLAKGIKRKVNRLGSFREVSLPKSVSQRSYTGTNQTNPIILKEPNRRQGHSNPLHVSF
jgi:hypothetical protein